MEIKRHLWSAARAATTLAAAALAGAALWDAGRLAILRVPPAVSYALLAAAAAAGCTGVLLRVLTRRPARARNTIELALTGIVLLAWWLRGHHAIPADPPLVVAEAVLAILLAGSAHLDRGRARSR